MVVDDLHITLARLFEESVTAIAAELKKARARAEQAEAKAAALRESLEMLRALVDRAVSGLEKPDIGRWLAALRQCDAALEGDAGRALLDELREYRAWRQGRIGVEEHLALRERVRKLERVAAVGQRLLAEYEREEEEHGFPLNFALRQAHREFRAALAALEADS